MPQRRHKTVRRKPTAAPGLDLSFVNAARVITVAHQEVRLVMVGCGGTGSWLAPSVARIARVLNESGIETSALFTDPDLIESKNIPRQNFCDAELRFPKAQTLAARYGLAWGIEIGAITDHFKAEMIGSRWNRLMVVIGCVDNAAARQELAKTLAANSVDSPPHVWWLDCGNQRESGQVLIGSTNDPRALRYAFPLDGFCQHLPSPALQCPDLLKPQPEELSHHNLSCAELALANAQGLIVNQRVAAEAADYLARLLIHQNLRRFATWFDLASGAVRNSYITPEQIQRFLPAKAKASQSRKGKR
ncbi:MAG: ThiF family adenylyltransferase [Acidobacteria bacterium]|nr:ThiF family adenylyltransferase [Acidobacteriota bacterium]